MKKYKIPVYEPYSSEILFYDKSYIPEGGWCIINIIWHIIMAVIIYKMI